MLERVRAEHGNFQEEGLVHGGCRERNAKGTFAVT
jgi:hypothetical protein